MIPYLIVRQNSSTIEKGFDAKHYTGIFLFALGIIITLACITSFAVKGKGTLSPADPTKQLVIEGLYKYSRNPMYVGVMLILIGEAIFFNAAGLWIYSAIIFIAFNLFIVFFEELRLKKDFGLEYENYCRKVRRWI